MNDGTGIPGIERDLGMLFTGIGALRELASDPEKAQDGSRIYDFNVRWGTLMSGRLIRLEHYHRSGELTGDQERCYRELKRELQGATPMIESLGISRPTVPLGEDKSKDESKSPKGGRREGERRKALLVEKLEEIAGKLRSPEKK